MLNSNSIITQIAVIKHRTRICDCSSKNEKKKPKHAWSADDIVHEEWVVEKPQKMDHKHKLRRYRIGCDRC